MNDDFLDGRDDVLDSTIAKVRSMATPEMPSHSLLLARVPSRSVALGRKTRRRWGVSIAVAASVLVAVVSGRSFLTSSPQVALAHVIESTRTYRLARYKIHIRAELKNELKERYVGDATNKYTAYADLKMPRMRLEKSPEKTLNDVAEQSWDEIIDYSADRWLTVYRFDLLLSEEDTTVENQKQAIRMVLAKGDTGPGRHERRAKLFRAPQPSKVDTKKLYKPYSDMGKELSFLEALRALQANDATKASKVMVGGREATKYRLEQGDWTSTLWVDADSRLPIRIQYDLVGEGAGEMFVSRQWVYLDFEWDPTVQDLDALFSTKAPEGYALEDHTSDP